MGDELISQWVTVERDRSALEAAVAVAVANISDVDIALIRDWTEREDPMLLEKFSEFERRVQSGH